jgi:hypothetical protein
MAYAKAATPVQPQVNQMSYELLNEYNDLTGGDYSQLDYGTELGRQYMKDVMDLKSFGKRTLMTDKIVKQMALDEVNKGRYIPEHMRRARAAWDEGTLNMKEFMKDPRRFERLERSLRSHGNAADKLKAASTGIKTDIIVLDPTKDFDFHDPKMAKDAEEAFAKIKGGNYDHAYTTYQKYMDVSRIPAIVDPVLDQNNIFLGSNKKDASGKSPADRKREEYYNMFISMFNTEFKIEDKFLGHMAAERAKSRAFKKKMVSTNILTNYVSRDKSPKHEGTKTAIAEASHMYNQGVGTAEDVRNALFKHTNMTPVIKSSDPDFLGARMPVNDKMKQRQETLPTDQLTYSVKTPNGVQTMSHGRAKHYASSLKNEYINQNKEALFAKDYPELHALDQLPEGYNITGRIIEDVVTYATKEGSEYVNLDAKTFAANKDNATNLLTRNVSATYVYDKPVEDNQGNPMMGYYNDAKDEFYPSKKEAQAADPTGKVSEPMPWTKKVVRKLPTVVSQYNLDDENQNALASGIYSTESGQLMKAGIFNTPENYQAPVVSGSSSSSSSTGQAGGGFWNQIPNN